MKYFFIIIFLFLYFFGNAVNPEADKRLHQQKHTDFISHLLLENLKITNKTGWITAIH